MTQSIRTFIAIEIDPAIQESLNNLQLELKKSGADVKWVKKDNIHLTLKFLGDTSEENIATISTLLARSTGFLPSFSVGITEAGAFPGIENPRVIWAGVHDPQETIAKIARSLEENLASIGFVKEERDFDPHITLGRVRTSLNKFNLVKSLKSLKMPPDLLLPIEKITLFKSTLTPQGPIYEVLKTVSLKK